MHNKEDIIFNEATGSGVATFFANARLSSFRLMNAMLIHFTRPKII